MTKGKNSGHNSLPQSLSHSPAGRGQFCGSFVTKQGHNSLPQQRPVLQPRGFDLSSVLTFLSLHTIAALSKKSEQHSTSTYHRSISSLLTRPTPSPRMCRHILHFLQPKQKPRKSPQSYLFQADSPSISPQTSFPTSCRRCSPDHLAANHLQLFQHSPLGRLKRQSRGTAAAVCQKPAGCASEFGIPSSWLNLEKQGLQEAWEEQRHCQCARQPRRRQKSLLVHNV